MNVLFVCTANAGPGVMAERLLLREAGRRLPDPEHERLERVRVIRDDIDRGGRELVVELDPIAEREVVR